MRLPENDEKWMKIVGLGSVATFGGVRERGGSVSDILSESERSQLSSGKGVRFNAYSVLTHLVYVCVGLLARSGLPTCYP